MKFKVFGTAGLAAVLCLCALPAGAQGLIGKDNPTQVPISSAFRQAAINSSTVLSVVNGILALPADQQNYVVEQLSGRGYAGLGTATLQTGLMFMNAASAQMGAARGTGSASRVALAEACDTACDGGAGPWSAWFNGLAGTGNVTGDGSDGAVTYSAFGATAGDDYRLSPQALVGVGIGYSHGNNSTSGIDARGTSDSYGMLLYASWSDRRFHIDGMAGYAYSDLQMTRNLILPTVAPMTAFGRTGANTFLSQIEAGYALALPVPANASLTPFVRLQGMTSTQAGFSESGAGPFSLTLAQQTTNSLRSTLGLEIAAPLDSLAFRFRLGWAHEYADTARPVSASFAGAPGLGYTIFGAAASRDSAVLGLEFTRAIASATDVFVRYDGDIGSTANSHIGTVGIRIGL